MAEKTPVVQLEEDGFEPASSADSAPFDASSDPLTKMFDKLVQDSDDDDTNDDQEDEETSEAKSLSSPGSEVVNAAVPAVVKAAAPAVVAASPSGKEDETAAAERKRSPRINKNV